MLCVGLSTYVILSFFISLYCRTNHSILVCSIFFNQSVFYSSPPLGLVTHFSVSSTLFTFLTSFSQLASLPVCSLCGLCCPCAVLGELGWLCCGRSAALLTHGQNHTWTRAIKHVNGACPPERPVSPGKSCSSVPLPPPPLSPLWSRPLTQRPFHPCRVVLLHTTHDLGTVHGGGHLAVPRALLLTLSSQQHTLRI